jgi:hypothetical protein
LSASSASMIGFADGVALNVNASSKAGAILRTVA